MPQRTRELLWGATRALSGYLHNDGIFGLETSPDPSRIFGQLEFEVEALGALAGPLDPMASANSGTVIGNRGKGPRGFPSLAP